MMRMLKSLRRDQDGSVIVDFALIATPLFLLLFGTIEVGRMLWMQNALHYSVEAAARCASIDTNNCATSTQITSYAAASSAAGLTSGVFSWSKVACGNQVSASYPMTLAIPFMSASITLSAQSCYPI